MVRTFVELGCKGDSAALKRCDRWVAELDQNKTRIADVKSW